MKRVLFLLTVTLLYLQQVQAQRQTWTEDFDGTLPPPGWTVSSTSLSGSWQPNTVYYKPGSSSTNPQSYRGKLPGNPGDSIVLTTPPYDCTTFEYVYLRFSHICKVSPKDTVKILYRIDGMGAWNPLPGGSYYLGTSNYNSARGFYAGSYPEWRADDSTVFPQQSWWRDELFDLSAVAGIARVEFRFIIKHGSVYGTHVSYGWLLDNFQLDAAVHEIYPPTVEFISPYVRDTVYNTGPWEINAKVKTNTSAPIKTPWLKYRATYNGTLVESDSILMTHVRGDSLWRATIKQFIAGTEISYSVTGIDSVWNTSTANSGYIIAIGSGETLVLQDGSTSVGYYPFQHGYGYSRSMALYPAAEMDKKVPGQISTVALRVATAGSAGFPMKIWLATVPANKTTWDATADNLDWAVLTQNATLVYDDVFRFATTGWNDISLTNMFNYNGTDNLVVLFEQNCTGTSCGSWMSTYSQYYYSTTQTERLWYKYSDNAAPTASSTLYRYAYRPDLRIGVIGTTDSVTVAMHSINMSDTAVISPMTMLPVVATIKNKGSLNLASTVVSYSVNSAAPISKNWYITPGLPWDFNYQDTVGYYTPKVNGFDTLVVWVSSPNGQIDVITWDDTLTKVVYSSTDMFAKFVNSPADTVYSTGPYEIKVKISTLSGTPVNQVPLQVACTYEGITTNDILTMALDASDNLWKTSIPQKRAGTDVAYSINLTDILGNNILLSGSYHIKLSCGSSIAGVADFQYTGNMQSVMLSPGKYELECWGAEGGATNGGGAASGISKIAGKGGYSVGTITLTSRTTVYVYVGGQGLSQAISAPGGFNGGGNSGAGAVIACGSGGGASDIRLGVDDLYARVIVAGGGGAAGFQECNGSSGVISGGHGGGTTGGTPIAGSYAARIGQGGTQMAGGAGGAETYGNGNPGSFGLGGNGAASGTSANGAGGGGGWYGGGAGANGSNCAAGGGGGSGYVYTLATASNYPAGCLLPNSHYLADAQIMGGNQSFLGPDTISEVGHSGNGYVRIRTISLFGDCPDYAAGTYSIDMPDTIMVSPAAFPVVATIRNAGVLDIDSAIVSYSVNGSVPVSKKWYSNPALPWDFNHQDTVGYYAPKLNGYDTLVVWVSLPNGEIDTITWDDTLTKVIYGTADMFIAFVNPPADTVFATGPYEIKARVSTLSGTPVTQVPLHLAYTHEGVTTHDILSMNLDAADNLWKTIIPQKRFGTDVAYSINLTDLLGNNILSSDSYFIKKVCSGGRTCDTNSVALKSVNSPGNSGEPAAIPVPVHVTILNKGIADLDSCFLNWSLNGVVQPGTTVYKGKLLDDFTDTITIGYYIAVAGKRDTVAAWVSMPNGHQDSTTKDDTLRVSPLGCASVLAGTYRIGQGGAFASLDDALTSIRNCGVNDHITLELKGTDTTNVNLSNMSDYMRGYTLTITSYDHDADSAVIYVKSGTGITFNNTSNIVFNNITIDGRNSNAHVVSFTAKADNIVFNHCKILGSPTTTSGYYCFYKTSGTGILNKLTVKNCIVDGGHTGIYFYVGSGDRAGITNIYIDSNKFINQYHTGVYCYYVYPTSISYNSIAPRSAGQGTTWYGINVYEGRSLSSGSKIVGNRIHSDNPGISSTLYGMRTYYVDSMLVTNNEIYLHSSASTTYGLYIDYPKGVDYLHNSILLTGTGGSTFIAVYWYTYENTSWDATMKNNIFIANGPNAAYAMYLIASPASYAANHRIDYNNYYSSGTNMGYAGTARTDLAAWRSAVTTDIHSVNILPEFTDVSSSLILDNYTSVFCPRLPGCTDDLLKAPRRSTTSMGAYTMPISSFDLMNLAVTNVPATVVKGQTVTVKVNVIGLGDTLIRNATFGWSLNGVTQTPPPTHTFAPVLNTFQTAEITIGTFAAQDTVTDIVVWIDQVNGKKDDNRYNDTANFTLVRVPMIEFMAPFVEDTIFQLSFGVNARINNGTGAPVSIPKLYIQTTVNGNYQLYDSITMVRSGSVWSATVPSQYYGSKVVYSLTVSDNVGNTETITDSTYIKFSGKVTSGDMTVPQTGSNSYSICGTVYPNLGPASGTSGGYSNSCNGYSVIYPAFPGVLLQVSGSFATESCCDYVQIYDGVGIGGTMLGEYRGTGTIPTLTSTTGPITIRFYSDGSVNTASNANYTGFVIQVNCYGSTLYPDNQLAVFNVVSPVNSLEELCEPDNAPVKIAVSNLGENDYNFAANPIELGARIINPLGHDTVYIRRIAGGTLVSGKTDTMEIVPAIPVMYAGYYDIKAWVSSPIDYIVYDDTIHYTYLSGKVGLPVDEDFSGSNLPSQFVPKLLVGTNTWTPYQPDTNVSPVKPQFGAGMLRFAGTVGTMAILSTRQLDMHGAVNPKLEFWYFHDTAVSVRDESYTDVKIVADGVSSTVLSVSKKGSTYGWTQYTVNLSSYATAQCVLIEFVSTNDNKSGLQSEQYIDRIIITSDQDLAISEIFITPEITACDLKNKDVYVIIRAPMAQAIDFLRYPTGLTVDIPGYTTVNYPLRGILKGNNWDTILIASNINLVPGKSNIRAYLTVPVDNNRLNDTVSLPLDISPSISVTTQPISGGTTSCLAKGGQIQQEVKVKNTGNVEISGIELLLNVITSSQQTLTKSVGSLNPGDSAIILFDVYTVPADAQYQVQVVGYMSCDSALVNSSTSVSECVDIHDLAITQLLSPDPLDGGIDQVGLTKEIEVSLTNTSDMTNYQHIDITTLIENENGQVLARHEDIIPVINALESNKSFKFIDKYTVPNEGVYYVRVFISKVDNYQENDTILVSRSTQNRLQIREDNVFTMRQNIPNPTDNSTIIRYSVPESGEIIFRIHSMNGQILYNRIIHSESGDQSIEINTLELSSGIYMYSMEYKDQRIVKRMIIKR